MLCPGEATGGSETQMGVSESHRYEVVFYGELLPGFTPESARENLAGTFLISPSAVAGINFEGGSSVIYSSASKVLAASAAGKFARAGLKCRVRKKSEAPSRKDDNRFFRVLDLALLAIIVIFAIYALSHMIDM